MDSDELTELLKNRMDVYLEWIEPWPARGPVGNVLNATVYISATVHDCINIQRASDFQELRSTMGDDARRLEEFMEVYWARPVRKEGGHG